jgi:hypothetical protein
MPADAKRPLGASVPIAAFPKQRSVSVSPGYERQSGPSGDPPISRLNTALLCNNMAMHSLRLLIQDAVVRRTKGKAMMVPTIRDSQDRRRKYGLERIAIALVNLGRE